ncbi:MAG: 4-hydroxybenzoyl-CoA thioesterase [Catenulispora sp. 13_1_20CM_3_70_7]|nr:MAG: 4-hydroxybenzoyl-CoA thioesterase [Catenulispora sp. 13_1_20CM_3_70_7]
MQARRTYDHRHRVMLEETNLLGNVYFSNYFLWQGHCREAFLLDHAPGVMRALRGDFAMITTDSSCDFFAELFAGDTVEVRMALAEQSATKVTMRFDYYRIQGAAPQLVARGRQGIACTRRIDGGTEPVDVPAELREALRPYAGLEVPAWV